MPDIHPDTQPVTRSRIARALASARLWGLLVGAALALIPVAASAFFSGSGAGTGTASVGTLGSPTGVTGSSVPGSGGVTVDWTAGSTPSGGPVDGYYVERYLGATPSPACNSAPGGLQPATPLSCVDSGVADGTYTYVVTAVFRSWTAVSAASAPVIVTMVIPTTTTMTSSLNPSVAGQAVTYTATVTPSVGSDTPTGAVTLKDGGTPIATCGTSGVVTLGGGAATCTVTYASTGSHTISGTYSGAAGFGASTSNTVTQTVNTAVAGTWIGAGVTNDWSDCNNWASSTCPTAGSSVFFDGTSTKSAVVDASFGGTVSNVSIGSGYTGTVSQGRSLTVSGAYSQSAGTFTAGSQMLTFAAFTLTGGSFTASSATTSVSGSFTISGAPTFAANGGTFAFNGATTGTLSCNNATFNLVTFTHTALTKTVNSDCSLPLGADPNANSGGSITLAGGTLSGSGTLTTSATLTLNSSSSLTGFSGLATSTLTVSGATLNAGSYTTFTVSAAFTLSSGSFTAPSGIMHVGGGFTISGAPTFTANGGTVDFSGATTATLACSVNTFNLVTFTHTAGTKTVTTCRLPLGADPNANSGGSITLSGGTLSGTGTLTTSGTLTLNASSSLTGFSGLATSTLTVSGATLNAGSYTTFTVSAAFTLSSGSFTAPSATMHVAGAFTISGAPTFSANGGAVDFNGATTATLACSVNTFNRVTFTHTAGTKTATTCSLPLGANPNANSGGSITLTGGTLSGTGTLTTSGTLTLNASSTLSGFTGLAASSLTVSGATFNAGGYTTFTMSSAFTLSGGSFTAPSGTMRVGAGFTISGAPTFNADGGTLNFNGASAGTLACSVNTFNLVTFTHTASTKTVTTCSFPLGASPLANSGGSITLTGGTLSGTGTLTTSGTLTLNAGGTLSGFSGLSAAAVTVSGATFNALSYSPFTTSGAFSLSSGTFTAPSGGMTLATTFTMSGGTYVGGTGTTSVAGAFALSNGAYTATSGILHVGGAFTISGAPTFTANGGTVDFNGVTAATLACTVNTFNAVTFTHAAGIKTVTTCSFPLGANPNANSGGSITLTGGTLSGSGTLTTSGALTFNAGGSLSGFSGLAASILTVSGGTLNAGASTTLTTSGAFTLLSGTFTAPSGTMTLATTFTMSGGTFTGTAGNMSVAGAFAISNGAFTAPSGIMHLGAALTISGSPTFVANGGTVDINGTTAATLACTVNTFNVVTFTHTAGIKTVTTCSFPLGADPSANSGGSITLTGGTLSGTGTLSTSGTLTLNAGATLSGFSGLSATTLTISGATFNAGGYATLTTSVAFTLSSGTFTAPAGTMHSAGAFTISGAPIFTANGGTVDFNGITSATLACTVNTFNRVTFTHTAGTKTVTTCNFPLGAGPSANNGGSITLTGGTLSGMGTLSTSGTLTLTSGTFSGFSGLSASALTIAGATLNAGAYTTFTVSGTFTQTSGTFTAPTGTMSVGGGFAHTAGTFTANGGTVSLNGAGQSISGTTTFFKLTKVVATADTLTFAAGSVQTITAGTGSLTLQGAAGQLLSLRSSVPGTQWSVNATSPRTLGYLNVQDANNTNATIMAAGSTSLNSGNNTSWTF